MGDFYCAVIALIRYHDVAVREQLGGVRIGELIGAAAADAVFTVLPYDGFVHAPYFDNPLVALVADQHISSGRQVGVLYRRIELIRPESGDTKLTVLPDDVAGLVDQQHAIIGTTGFLAARGGTSGHAIN